MLKLATNKDRFFFSEVIVHYPNEAGGQTKVEFDIKFKLLTKDQEDELSAEESDDEYELRWFKEHVHGWKRIVDEDTEKPIEFSAEALLALYKDPIYRAGIMRTYYAKIQGVKTKN